MDPQDMARFPAVRSEMADLRKDLLAARYRTESALMAFEEGDTEAARYHLVEAQRAIERAGERTHLPEDMYLRRLPRSAAAKIFKDGFGESGP